MITTAMLLAAGFGRRLHPLTLVRPKPMFPVLNKTMLQWWAEFMVSAGITRVVVNTHYMAPLMLEHLESLTASFKNKLEILISPEDEILGTGGGLKKAAHLLKADDFLVINADIFSDFELVKLARRHLEHPGRLATLGLLEHVGEANVSVGEGDSIVAFRRPQTAEGEIARRAYCGVMAVSARIFDYIPEGFSDIINVFTEAMRGGADIGGWVYDPAIWQDMGRIDDYWRLNEQLAAGRAMIHSAAVVAGEAHGWNVIGAGARVEAGAEAHNCVIWPNSAISKGAVVKNAVVIGRVPEGHVMEGGFFCDAPGA